MGDYNIIYFWTLTFPLATMLSITMAAYLSLKTRYIECRLKYDVKFRNSDKGRRYMKRMERREKMLECFRYKNFDVDDDEISQ